MPNLPATILVVLEEEDCHRVSAAHLVDVLDRHGVDFSLQEFDAALTSLQEAGKIRVTNPSAPVNDQRIQRIH